ncbi:MAG: hypothetical protein LT106_18820 [Burkholderiaceae bacterium]|nr:hypothetical protein [Burkholderiaceae bacterium]
MSAVIEHNSSNPFASGAPVRASSVTSEALAAQQREIAETQAKLIMAEKFPRDEVAAMDRILNAFTRPTLAEQAQYQYSKGGSDVSGPSIRSAEAIAQLWGNMEFGFREKSRGRGDDGVTYSEVEAFAWDLQNRTRRPLTFILRHWRDTKRGGYPIKDEREIYELMANMAQRRVRACIIAVIPGDVFEAAMKQADATLHAKADTSPDAMARMVEAFAAFEVTKEHIEKRIQRRLEAIQPAQVVSLKKIYASLRDGMSAPHEWFEIEPPAPEVPPAVTDLNAKIGARSKQPPAPKREAPADVDAEQAAGLDQAMQPPQPPPDAAAPPLSFAQIAERLKAAKTLDEIDEAASLIESLPALDQRKELVALYRELRAKLEG